MPTHSVNAPERFARLRKAFHRLIELDLSQREAELALLAEADADFGVELRNLLGHTDESDLIAPLDPAPPQLGAFRPLHMLGTGGMGEVWLADRVEGGFEQQVALKRIRDGALSPGFARSFLRERQILARLSHPNIAHLVDGGVGPDGHPWLAMEYVDGQNIDRWCESRQLDAAARVRLFLPICEAVAFAHRNLVIHRDLKPANILVDTEGRPRLLDFGIARLLDSGNGEQTRTLGAMTPAYAAPEQRDGGDITTATDVYQLGAVLRKLIQSAADGVQAQRGDLGYILDKALMANPVDRYAGATVFANDLADWLAMRSPRSGIGSRSERLKKTLWQLRWPLALLATAVLAIGIGGVLALREAQAKAREAEASRQTTQFMVGLFQGADPSVARGSVLSAQDLLDQGRARLSANVQLPADVRARLLHAVADSYAALGRYDQALSLAEQSLAARRADASPAETAESLDQVGNVLRLQAEYGRAEPLLREALRLRETNLPADDPALIGSLAHLAALRVGQGDFKAANDLLSRAADAAGRRYGKDAIETAAQLESLAQNLSDMGKRVEALELHRRVLAIRERELGPDDPEVATTLASLGVQLSGSGQYAEAVQLMERALAIRTRTYGASHPLVAFARIDLAGIKSDLGQLDDAASLAQKALESLRASLAPDHPRISEALNMQALIRMLQRDYASAIPLQQEVLQRYISTLGEDHPNTLLAKNNLGYALLHDGHAKDAEVLLRDALARKRRDNGQGAHDLQNLASALLLQGKNEEAIELQRSAVALQREREGETSAATAVALRELAIAEELGGKDAEHEYRAALAMAEEVGKTNKISLRGWQIPLAAYLVGAGSCDEARPLLQSALAGMANGSADPIELPQVQLLMDACAVAGEHAAETSEACAVLRALPGVRVDVYPTTRRLLSTRCGMQHR